MPLEHINPSDNHPTTGYTHVVRATGQRTAYISGQIALDLEGNIVGVGDLEAQARQAFANLAAALTAVGADFSNVAKMTIYIVNYTPEALPALQAARAGAAPSGAPPATTLIGVQALAFPELLIEVEAIAVLD
ncbi:MAG TPA: RidA family protein [Dehalococcoidia bacterium]|nr:RidA family protein [Dehalococcoidia bacterium]